ncbi:MAG TPA: NAD(P)H-dependent glycerol-3-phosphate dehydrogenase [Kiritimatiellia bacterium]|nr:NAD(P)H-dependent glycerol-3-phosphate dehydrogenase [Kiritimatiellia bacterium]HRZ11525.1 NAD(P)H-dependent glycerol-3-phosphate dehydrogenase [Kiritimatiellia bacterium]HSA16924.1 NAD(P)H-dependent glycerol-3-phosphate dehydrogenase [Kiritimatiellia bacterium]
MKIAVIGDGGWGTALALILAGNGHEVSVWGPFEDYLRTIRETGENKKFLPGVRLPSALRWTARLDEAAAGAEAVVLATPSRFFRGAVSALAPFLPNPRPLIVSVTKGLDEKTHRRMTEVAGELLGGEAVAALSGPSLAAEVARGVPTAVTIACADMGRAAALQLLFNGPRFRVYTSDDVVGVELGGALKNVIAIAAGVCDGIGFGDNAKAALITRGLAEIGRLGVAMGAHPQTFAGLSGLGDLVVTCASRLSRNRGVGERLGRGESMEAILQGMQQVAEGVWTCGAARDLARSRNVEVPITEEVCAVVHEGKNPRRAVEDLMSRDPRPERE